MKPTLLFAAHDIGGGRVLAALHDHCADAGYRIRSYAEGPARQVLEPFGTLDRVTDCRALIRRIGPTVVVTGTSKEAELERQIWTEARRAGIPSIAFLDASINFGRRFQAIRPDVVCTLDEASVPELEEIVGPSVRIEVVGQPHLERVSWSARQRTEAPDGTGAVVFYSEPLAEKHGQGHPVGYDQFSVATLLLDALMDIGDLRLVIKPHPNEHRAAWEQWETKTHAEHGARVEIADREALELMRQAHGVASMASMALIEAALMGLPALALQPGRQYCPNPRVDANADISLVTKEVEVTASVRKFVTASRAGSDAVSERAAAFDGSTARGMAVISSSVAAAASRLTTEVEG